MKQLRNRNWWRRKFNLQEGVWITLKYWFFSVKAVSSMSISSQVMGRCRQTLVSIPLFFLKTSWEVKSWHVLFKLSAKKDCICLGGYSTLHSSPGARASLCQCLQSAPLHPALTIADFLLYLHCLASRLGVFPCTCFIKSDNTQGNWPCWDSD